MSSQDVAIANSSPLSRATTPALPISLVKRSDTARNTRSPLAWPSRSLMCWKLVEANDQKRHFGAGSFGGRNHRSQPGFQRIAVGEAGQRVVFGEVADFLGFALAHRDVAQDRAILEAVGALPAGETGFDRKYFTIAAPGVEFDHLAGAERRRALRIENGVSASVLAAQIVSNGRPIISSGP